MSLLNLDLSDAPTGMGFDPIPAGEYPAQIINTELAHSQGGDLMLNLTWQVMDGEYKGRMLFDRVMLGGSDKAVAFGKRKLKTIADAIGHPNPNRIEDTEELHGLPCLIAVTIKPYNGEDRNEVRDYKPTTAVVTSSGNPPAKTATSAPAPSKTAPPPPKKSQAQTPFDPPAENQEGQ